MKPPGELLFNLAALALVAAFAYFFFWGFLALVGVSVLITTALMLAEKLVARE